MSIISLRCIMSMHSPERVQGRRENPGVKREEGCPKARRHKPVPSVPVGAKRTRACAKRSPNPPCICPSPRGMEGGTFPQPACLWGRRPPRRPRGGPRPPGMPLGTRRRPVGRDLAFGRQIIRPASFSRSEGLKTKKGGEGSRRMPMLPYSSHEKTLTLPVAAVHASMHVRPPES